MPTEKNKNEITCNAPFCPLSKRLMRHLQTKDRYSFKFARNETAFSGQVKQLSQNRRFTSTPNASHDSQTEISKYLQQNREKI